MRHFAFLCGAVLILASGAGAQLNSASPFLLGSPLPAIPVAAAAPDPAAAMPAANAWALSAPADPPQGVYGVFQDFNFQAYAGYTFFRFYALPNLTENMNGLNFSVAYYPHGHRIGADGEIIAAFGSAAGVSSKFVSGMGGARYRRSGPRGLEVWAHGLAGGAHFLPQTPYGGLNAFSLELGGGVDFMPRHRRLGYRLQADMVATRFFGTFQYSPKISAGIVFKF
jgi:hypothetical protein